MEQAPKLKWEKGTLIIEVPTVIRVPIELEAITKSLDGNVKLTIRQQQVLNGLLKGWSNKEIASAVKLSERTVKFHVSALLVKFLVHTRMEIMHIFRADRS